MKVNHTYFSANARCYATALALGGVLLGTAMGLERAVGKEQFQSPSPNFIANTSLSSKKACVLLSWQQQWGSANRARCNQYFKQKGAGQPVLANIH